ncbi:MAG: TonB-dependent receptor [Cyclobacteriaceae bacterium]
MAQSQKVSLLTVLNKLEEERNVRFAYDYELVKATMVDIPDFEWDTDEILSNTLGNNLFFEKGDRVIIIAPLPPADYYSIKDKNFQFTGYVRDSLTGEALPNATIQIVANKQFTTANDNGFFTLTNVPHDTSSIRVEYLGFKRVVIKPNQFEDGLVNINLPANPEILEPLVVSDKVESFTISNEVGKISLSPVTMQLISPFGQPDIIRSIQLLPGVTGSSETSAGLSIRGGTPDQNLIMFDGFTVYSLDHFFGALSSFNSNVIRDIDLYKSGFGAKYGGRVSSVLNITSRDGSFTDRPRGSVGFDMMSANMMLESPIGEKVSFMLAGRRSYGDVVQSNLYNKVLDNVKNNDPDQVSSFGNDNFINQVDPEFKYYDVNAKLNYKINDDNRLDVSFYNSSDKLDIVDNEFFENTNNDTYFKQEFEESTSWGNTGLSVNFHHNWNPLLSSKLSVANSRFAKDHSLRYFLHFRSNGQSNVENINIKDKNEVNESSVRLDNQYQISENSLLEFGAFNINHQIEYHNVLSRNALKLDIRESGNQTGVYIQQTYTPISNLSVTGGLRGTYYTGTDNTYLEPRISLNYRPYPELNIKGAVGRYYQFITETTTNNPFLNRYNFWLIADGFNVSEIGSNHFVGGASFAKGSMLIDVEGYYKTLDGLTTYALDSALNSFDNGEQEGILYRGNGRVKGLDVMVKNDFGSFTSWISYSLSSVRHKFLNVNEGAEFNANQDQRHEVKWVGMLRAGHWEVSGTFVFGSGRPFTGFPFNIGQQVSTDMIVDKILLGGADTNNRRMPSYHRFDLGVAYSMNFGKYTDGKLGVNLFNIYNRGNIKDIRYDVTYNSSANALVVTENRLKLLNFTPSVYFNFYF